MVSMTNVGAIQPDTVRRGAVPTNGQWVNYDDESHKLHANSARTLSEPRIIQLRHALRTLVEAYSVVVLSV